MQAQDGPIYAYVSHWNLPRAQWGAANEFMGSNPIFDKLIADGTIVHWGAEEVFVHGSDGRTHGTWFAATSLASIDQALTALTEGPANPAINHDADPAGRVLWHVTPTAEAQVSAAIRGVLQNAAVVTAFGAVSVGADHRDYLGRVLGFAHR